MKKMLSLLLAILMLLSITACANTEKPKPTPSDCIDIAKYFAYANMSPEEVTAQLTLEQKAAQMLQPAVYWTDKESMEKNCYGSVLSQFSNAYVDYKNWQSMVDELQEAAVNSEAGIPYIYGQDDVHGVNYCQNTVIFPHNIGQGAANDPELAYKVGQITADEAKLCHMLWNFSPCVARSGDPRWGRTYESYGADLDIIKSLSTAYSKGMLDSGSFVVCAKHFFADGDVAFGTGENSDVARLIDRGDATLTEAEINDLLSVYQQLVDTGVQSIMLSHSSVNGVKMHENAKYIQYLKNEMGFEGVVLSDWNAVQNTSPASYREQIITAVNSGVDMLMEVDRFDEAIVIIISAVNEGKISEERVNDAVTRIIRMKQNAGVFADPFCKNMTTVQAETGTAEYRAVAEQLVEKSLVLLKNEGDVLPLKSGATVYITGGAANDASVQCGGWTIGWNSSPETKIAGVTTVLEGFKQKAAEYGITVTTDVNDIEKADVVIEILGEKSYAEWNGDTEDMDLCGTLGLPSNKRIIGEVEKLNKPTVACIIAGRQVIIDDYVDKWDGVVMCYLPGSEGQGVADVLCGGADFTGRLPSPWYSSVEQIGADECWLDIGYGLSYAD